ncbi:MAG: MerR family transcriptional regulator [Pseudomonadota bacterium]
MNDCTLSDPLDEQDNDTYPLTIREVAERFDLSLRTLRFYEQKGLVAPSRDGRYRVYDRKDIERLKTVLAFRDIGLTVREVKELIDAINRATDPSSADTVVNRFLERRLREIESEMSRLRDQEYQAIRLMRS